MNVDNNQSAKGKKDTEKSDPALGNNRKVRMRSRGEEVQGNTKEYTTRSKRARKREENPVRSMKTSLKFQGSSGAPMGLLNHNNTEAVTKMKKGVELKCWQVYETGKPGYQEPLGNSMWPNLSSKRKSAG